MSQSEPLLTVTNLTKVFGSGNHTNRAVDDVTFTANHGEIIAIVGESGSGKSTLARMLLRLSKPTSGSIHLGDMDASKLKRATQKQYWRDVQGIFQNPVASFNQFYSVGRVLQKTMRLVNHPGSKAEQRAKMDAVLTAVDLNPREVFQKAPHELSGGQLQRAMIARALLVDPKVLIADESTSALDASLRVTVLNKLVDLRDSRDMTILFITHDIGQAYYISDRIFVMYKGQMVEQGPTEHVLLHPQHEYTQRLLADVPRVGDWGTQISAD